MEPFDAVIFDMDGVLVDSEVIVTRIESEMLAELGVTMTPDEIVARFTGLSDAVMAEHLDRDWGVTLPTSFDADRRARTFERFDAELGAVAGMDLVVDDLSFRGVPRAVASSSSPDRIAKSLELVGMAAYFGPHLYSATMVAHGKPAPDLFLYAAAQLDVDPTRCVVIEDSAPGVIAGKAAGMRVIGLTAAGHCGPDHGERLLAAGADHHAASAANLADLLHGPNARLD
ncbi:MAG: HAD family hydrolase [Actinobacteria bacterium]|nr:HAD family hydrolase [Actinomycetota bacterium]